MDPTISGVSFTNNATDDQWFKAFMYQQSQAATDNTFDVHVVSPSDPAVLCLFTLPKWMGDVACYGAGSGNVPDNMLNRAQSVVPHGGVQFWMYAGSYGDAGGVQYSNSISDLTQVPYGTGNFNNKIKALWIVDPMNPRQA